MSMMFGKKSPRSAKPGVAAASSVKTSPPEEPVVQVVSLSAHPCRRVSKMFGLVTLTASFIAPLDTKREAMTVTSRVL